MASPLCTPHSGEHMGRTGRGSTFVRRGAVRVHRMSGVPHFPYRPIDTRLTIRSSTRPRACAMDLANLAHAQERDSNFLRQNGGIGCSLNKFSLGGGVQSTVLQMKLFLSGNHLNKKKEIPSIKLKLPVIA